MRCKYIPTDSLSLSLTGQITPYSASIPVFITYTKTGKGQLYVHERIEGEINALVFYSMAEIQTRQPSLWALVGSGQVLFSSSQLCQTTDTDMTN